MEEAATMLISDGFGMGMDVLGIEELPDSDFMAFLGDLAVDPLDPISAGVVATTIPALEATAPKAPPLQLPSAAEPNQTSWQVTTGQLLKQPSMRGSPCSSAASADETNCPESPMVTSAVTSSEAAHTAPASAATAGTNTTAVATRKRQRPQASPTPSLQTQSEGTAPESQDEPHLTKAQLAAAKRRAPVVDWRAIDDPEERRKQRRLAKNRVTAAR
jgi:cyclic AMP-dependent transcription factor ATF-2